MNVRLNSNFFVKLFWWSWVGAVSLGQLGRWQVSTTIATYPHDLIIGLALAYSWWQFRADKSWQSTLQQLGQQLSGYPWWVAWIGWGWLLAFLTSGTLPLVPLLYTARLLWYAAWGGWLYLQVKHRQLTTPELKLGLLVWGSLVAWLGLLQYWLLPDTRFLSILGWDDHYYRLISTLLDPGATGLLLAVTLLALPSLTTTWPAHWKKAHWLVVASFALALALTFSRTSYVAALMGAVSLVALHPKWRSWWNTTKILWLSVALSVILGGYVLLPKPASEGVRLERTASIFARFDNAITQLTSLQPHQWLSGRGLFTQTAVTTNVEPSSLVIVNHARVPDNLFILLLTQLGIVGCGLSLWLMYQVGHSFKSRWTTWLPPVTAILIASLSHNALLQPFIWLWLMSWCALNALELLELKRHR